MRAAKDEKDVPKGKSNVGVSSKKTGIWEGFGILVVVVVVVRCCGWFF